MCYCLLQSLDLKSSKLEVAGVKNHLSLILTLLLSVFALGACNYGYITWSPDGNTMAFIGHDGLRFCDPAGKLSEVAGGAESVALSRKPVAQARRAVEAERPRGRARRGERARAQGNANARHLKL